MSAAKENDFDEDAKDSHLGEEYSGQLPGGPRTSFQGALSATLDPRFDVPLLDGRLPVWFWANVVVWQHEVVQGECWSWKRPLDPEGYGLVSRCIPIVHAHQMAWEALIGPVPNGMFLDHSCRNRACVRPAHLELVETGENSPLWIRRFREVIDRMRLSRLVHDAREAGNQKAGRVSGSPATREVLGVLFEYHSGRGRSRKSDEGSVQFGDPRLPKRFWRSVMLPDRPDGCWEWCGSRTRMGYGRILWAGDPWMAHRVSYVVLVKLIPEGHDVHHRCKNPGCVRPDHLMAVTRREHLQLDGNPIMQRSEQTHCIRGHAFTPENTSVRPGGGRTCRRCDADRAREIRGLDLEATRERERMYMRDYRRRKADAVANGKPFITRSRSSARRSGRSIDEPPGTTKSAHISRERI